jgi:hypothetical protein
MRIKVDTRIKKAFASSTPGQTHGQVNMQPPGPHSYASQSCTENAIFCRDEGCRITVSLACGPGMGAASQPLDTAGWTVAESGP